MSNMPHWLGPREDAHRKDEATSDSSVEKPYRPPRQISDDSVGPRLRKPFVVLVLFGLAIGLIGLGFGGFATRHVRDATNHVIEFDDSYRTGREPTDELIDSLNQ